MYHPSKRKIMQALLSLAAEKPYLEITVTDLVKRANVARITFYRNYSSVDDIVNEIIDETYSVIEKLQPAVEEYDDRIFREFLFNAFYYMSCNREKLVILQKPENCTLLFSRMNAKIFEREKEKNLSTENAYTYFGISGFVLNIALKWLYNDMKETPEQMINLIVPYIEKLCRV